MGNTRRIPFVLNLDDPVDAALWEALQPMLERRRASQFIRGAVAHALGMGGLLSAVVTPALPASEQRLALRSGALPRAKRPTRKARAEAEPVAHRNGDGDEGALDEATGNFLSMFG